MLWLERRLSENHWIVLALLMGSSLANALQHVGSLSDFFTVMALHAFFGKTIYSYALGRALFMGGAIGKDAPLLDRRVGVAMALLFFCAVFFY